MMKLLSEQLSITQRAGLGKKAGNLNELLLEGFTVPDGFVLRWEDRDSFEASVDKLMDKIGGYPVAVRSSGQLEDLGDMSFAGLYETYLDINSREELLSAISKCFESTQGERVEKYLEKADIKKTSDELYKSFSVLVQKMIIPKTAGVAFSIDPMTGIEEHLYAECCHGVGEKLVSGEVTPNRYTYNHYSKEIIESDIHDDLAKLSDKNIRELSILCRKIQAFYGRPQDLEWAIDDSDQLWLLQARPITKLSWRKDHGELTNADLKDGGISSAVCTPLMFSLYQKCMNVSMPEYFKSIKLWKDEINPQCLYYFYGRGYWSAGNVKLMLKDIPGYNEKSFDEDLGIMKDYGSEGPEETGLSIQSILKALPVVLSLEREFKSCFKDSSNYLNEFRAKEAKYLEEVYNLHNTSDDELLLGFDKMIHEFFIPTETAYYRVIYNNSNLQTTFKEFLEKIEQRIKEKINTIHLFTGIDGISHLEIQKDLKELHEALENEVYEEHRKSPKVEKALKKFLARHYHHGDRELDITVPRWGEVPDRVIELAKNYNHVSTPTDLLYREEIQRVMTLLDKSFLGKFSKKKFQQKTDFVRSYLKLREGMRELSTCSYYIVRLYILEIQRRWLKSSEAYREDDIFFYTLDELIALARNESKLSDHSNDISYRKLTYEGFKKFESPNDFGFGVKQSQSQIETIDGEIILRGIACSPGEFEGVALVAKSLEDIDEVDGQSILITKFTDPGWTPTLGRVKGVVTEVGGILSHAAVISREYGIPAILNIPEITDKIKNNQKIYINGDEGVVIIRRQE